MLHYSLGLNSFKLFCICPLTWKAQNILFTKPNQTKPNQAPLLVQECGCISSPLPEAKGAFPSPFLLITQSQQCFSFDCLVQTLVLFRRLHELTQLTKTAEVNHTKFWVVLSTFLGYIGSLKSLAKAEERGWGQGCEEVQGRRARPDKHPRWWRVAPASELALLNLRLDNHLKFQLWP